MSLGSLAAHVAALSHFGLVVLTIPQVNMSTDKFPKFVFTTPDAAVEHAADIRTVIASISDEAMQAHWRLLFNNIVIADAPKVLLYRTMFFNHLIHHRGQLGAYLRLREVPVPGIYGPSADEPFEGSSISIVKIKLSFRLAHLKGLAPFPYMGEQNSHSGKS